MECLQIRSSADMMSKATCLSIPSFRSDDRGFPLSKNKSFELSPLIKPKLKKKIGEMQDFRILDGGAGSELQDLGFHVNVSIYLRKLAWLDPHMRHHKERRCKGKHLFLSFGEWKIYVHYLSRCW